jgi:hypothetical protein
MRPFGSAIFPRIITFEEESDAKNARIKSFNSSQKSHFVA